MRSISLLSLFLVIAVAPAGFAQQNQNQQNTTNNFTAGVSIDPAGVLKPAFGTADSKRLAQERRRAKDVSALSAEIAAASKLRKVSLVRLQQVCRAHIEAGEPIPPDVFHLAGLQRIDYVFLYPDERDLVIAGPAEGFFESRTGSTIGFESGRPVLRLDDLLVALQTVPRNMSLGCSIDPEPERLAAMLRYANTNSAATTTAQARQRYAKMREILGLQNVSIHGVPPESHYARVLVAADYRMKLISLGLEKTGIRGLPSHLSLLRGGGNAIQRWWFTPLYDAFETNEDRTAFQFNGQRAQLLSDQELADVSGNRTSANFTKGSTAKFAKAFTLQFSELGKRAPLFAELANLIDLAVLAALIDKERLDEQIEWDADLFRDPAGIPIPEFNVPKQVPSASASKLLGGGRSVIGLVGGGVTIRPRRWLGRLEVDPALGPAREDAKSDRAKDRWWWD